MPIIDSEVQNGGTSEMITSASCLKRVMTRRLTRLSIRGLSKGAKSDGGKVSAQGQEEQPAFSNKMNVVGKRMQDSIRMLDAGALYSQTNRRDPNLPAAPKQVRAKLSRTLETPQPRSEVLSERQKGMNTAFAEEIMDVLNEAMASSKIGRGLFRGTDDASAVVEITACKVNSDVSHIYAEWSSPIINGFADEIKGNMGEEKAKKFQKKSENYVTARLAMREGRFRTYLLRRIESKRVPRIYFKPFRPKNEFGPEQKAALDKLLEESLGKS